MPGEIERAIATLGRQRVDLELAADRIKRGSRARKTRGIAHDARVVPHRLMKPIADRLEIAFAFAVEGAIGARQRRFDDRFVGGARRALSRYPSSDRLPGDAAEHGRIGHTVAAEAVGTVYAARILAGDEESRKLGRAIGREFHAAHQV